MSELGDAIAGEIPELVRLRRDLHAHPELAFEEARTAEAVASALAGTGIELVTGIAETGIVGRLTVGSGGSAIGLRADMDALPLTELNAFAHRSRNQGRMHACGHDGHTAMLVGAARVLARRRNFEGTVYFIFQPAEEGKGGARRMIEEGLFERFPMQSVYGLHNWPGLPAGSFGVLPGPVMAGADEFDITVTGRGAHAAMPHLGVDAITAAAAMVQALHSIVARNVDPLDSAVVSVTQFHAGEAYNVLPEQAVLRGTVRAFKPQVQAAVEAGMRRVCEGVAGAHGVQVDVAYRRGYPPTINHDREAELCRSVAAELVGQHGVIAGLAPTMGAEDFAFMLRERPGCYVWLGTGPGESGCFLHNPRFDFNDEVIPVGVAYWVRLAERVLART